MSETATPPVPSRPSISSVRAKFFVSDVNVYSINPPQRQITLKPVYSTDPAHENKTFWDATPSGELKMTINNAVAAEFFQPGTEYYIDFSEAPPTPPNVYPTQLAK